MTYFVDLRGVFGIHSFSIGRHHCLWLVILLLLWPALVSAQEWRAEVVSSVPVSTGYIYVDISADGGVVAYYTLELAEDGLWKPTVYAIDADSLEVIDSFHMDAVPAQGYPFSREGVVEAVDGSVVFMHRPSAGRPLSIFSWAIGDIAAVDLLSEYDVGGSVSWLSADTLANRVAFVAVSESEEEGDVYILDRHEHAINCITAEMQGLPHDVKVNSAGTMVWWRQTDPLSGWDVVYVATNAGGWNPVAINLPSENHWVDIVGWEISRDSDELFLCLKQPDFAASVLRRSESSRELQHVFPSKRFYGLSAWALSGDGTKVFWPVSTLVGEVNVLLEYYSDVSGEVHEIRWPDALDADEGGSFLSCSNSDGSRVATVVFSIGQGQEEAALNLVIATASF